MEWSAHLPLVRGGGVSLEDKIPNSASSPSKAKTKKREMKTRNPTATIFESFLERESASL